MQSEVTFAFWVKDTIERVGITVLQALLVFIPSVQVWDKDTWKAFAAAGIVAALNVLKAAGTAWMPRPRAFIWDLLIRALWTFLLGVFGTALTDTFDVFDVTAWRAAAVGSLMAVLAVVKGLLAVRVANTITPASLAKKEPGEPLPPAA